MKTAILVLAMYYSAMTSQIVPADQCEALAKQFVEKQWSGAKATCLYVDAGAKK